MPLSLYRNPPSAPVGQPRCFPQQNGPPLILFCKHGFQEISPRACGHRNETRCSPFPSCSLKAGYTAHSANMHRNAGSYLIRTRSALWPHTHKKRSPRRPGRIFHAVEMRPESLTPSTHPKLGVKSRHQGLHRYALQRIFRPFLGDGRFD